MAELDASHADASRRYAPHFAALGRRALVENSLDGMQNQSQSKEKGRGHFASATGDTAAPLSEDTPETPTVDFESPGTLF